MGAYNRDNELVEVGGLYLKVNRTKAYGVSFAPNDSVEVWLPKSLVEDGSDLEEKALAGLKEPATASLPAWFVAKEELA